MADTPDSRPRRGTLEGTGDAGRGRAPLPAAPLWLVDGYNVLHCAPFRGTRAARDATDSTNNTNNTKNTGNTGNEDAENGEDAKGASSPAADPGDRDAAANARDAPSAAATPGRFWSQSMRQRLVAVARRFPDPNAAIWLVFDGARPAAEPLVGERPEVRIHFAHSADDWIVNQVKQMRLAEAAKLPGGETTLAEEPSGVAPVAVAVVSGDRRLANRARHHGAAVVSPRAFLDQCGLGTTKASTPTRDGSKTD